MDILKQNIYLVLLHFIFEIALLSCESTATGGSSSTKIRNTTHTNNTQSTQYRRQGFDLQTPGAMQRTKIRKMTKRRSTPFRDTFTDQCSFILHYCHRTYKTGRLCARTLFYAYYTFRNYCMMDYANCKETYEVWQVAHFGQCYTLKTVTEYIHVEYNNDSFLDTDYVIDDQSAEQSSPVVPFHNVLRQDIPAYMVAATESGHKFHEGLHGVDRHKATGGPDRDAAPQHRNKKRTTPKFYSRNHYCDYWARPVCMHSYVTGKLCARTIYYMYQTFKDYCLMEYVNCRENYEVWQVVHMGGCFSVPKVQEFVLYAYHDDGFLDNYYLLEDKFNAKK
ncbi:hypothetical protein PYW07_010014 [Mythimna separata]|uniref:Uncharacterized protein n=1 Tax=Mythimna separata TaxID=271217 RepID=A0AAD8DQ65_MYTSE|nr:hypothetical protein PYW07_010014 [Mythimna separata]